jgi:thiamine biosynthesis lipoprotein
MQAGMTWAQPHSYSADAGIKIPINTNPAHVPGLLLRRAHIALGTLIELQCVAHDAALGMAGMRAACEVIDRIHNAMSTHSPHSDLAHLARAAPGSLLQVDAHTTAVLQRARHWSRLSGSRFNPLCGATLQARGLRPGLVPGPAPWAHSLDAVHVEHATLLRVLQPLALDFGGIAKGYAVDCAVQAMQAAGIGSGLVNAGGDLRAFGPRVWPLVLRLPQRPQGRTLQQAPTGQDRRRLAANAARDIDQAIRRRPSAALPIWLRQGLRDAALAVSHRDHDQAWFDPHARLARSRQTPAFACVMARRCVDADALTKVVLNTSLAHAPDDRRGQANARTARNPLLTRAHGLPSGLLQGAGARAWVLVEAAPTQSSCCQ